MVCDVFGFYRINDGLGIGSFEINIKSKWMDVSGISRVRRCFLGLVRIFVGVG